MLTLDLKARLLNKAFWVSLISLLVLLAQQFGLDITTIIPKNYADIINTIFAILALLGIVVDTSTQGFSDKSFTPDQGTKNVFNVDGITSTEELKIEEPQANSAIEDEIKRLQEQKEILAAQINQAQSALNATAPTV